MNDPENTNQLLTENKSPYSQSILGEYGRMFLLLVIVPLLIFFAIETFSHRYAYIFLVVTAALLAMIFVTRGIPIVRIGILIILTINVASVIINSNYVVDIENSRPGLPAYLLLVCLGLAGVFEISRWSSGKRFNLTRSLFWGLLAAAAGIYILGVPVVMYFLEAATETESDRVVLDPDWNWFNEISFRAAKFGVFGVFTYLGACTGSFLNVLAYAIPRGEPVGLRDSKCPQCGAKIRRIDNLPIYSYINLSGKCRNCQQHIPIRYLLVELIGAAIFGSLFLYQLVAGCPNVPFFETYLHTGMLWMILYPKWPAIGIYVYHSLFMCVLLTLALFEWDRQVIRIRHILLVFFLMLIPASVFTLMQPVPTLAQTPLAFEIPPIIDQLLKLVIGGVAGAVVGVGLGRLPFIKHASTLTLAFALTGCVIGWQGLLQVTLIFIVMFSIIRMISPLWNRMEHRFTALLLAAVMIHHPFWKTMLTWWNFF